MLLASLTRINAFFSLPLKGNFKGLNNDQLIHGLNSAEVHDEMETILDSLVGIYFKTFPHVEKIKL